MHSLCMLTQIIQSGEAARAVALKRSFARMFPIRLSEKPPKRPAKIRRRTYRMCRARCSLRVKLSLQGGKSVHQNLWPFFFLDGRPSASTLSASEPISSSSSSSISTSCDSTDWVDLCESPRCAISGLTVVSGFEGCENELAKGEVGNGRWPVTPAKVALVGVLGAETSAVAAEEEEGCAEDRACCCRACSCWASCDGCEGCCGEGGRRGARGVVGVVASAEYVDRPRPTLLG